MVASRPPVVDTPSAAEQSAPPATPLPEPVPQQQYNASNGTAPGVTVPTVYPERDTMPAYQGAMPGLVVTPTSGISYPTQPPAASSAGANSGAESAASDAMPPLPPAGTAASEQPGVAGSPTSIAPLPPVR